LIDKNGENQGITDTQDAVAQAKSVGLDLVVVAPRSDDEAPVAKILDYGKQQYQKKKRQSKSKSSKPSLKEVKLRPNVDDSDYGIRIKRAIKWLDKGNMVKFQVRLRGREHQHRDRAYELLERVIDDLKPVSEVQSFDKRSLIVQVSPA
jgi:translation initiation factor IF-3